MIHEGLYAGRVWHERRSPENRFARRLLLAYCDVDAIDESPSGRIRIVPGLPIFVRRGDYLDLRESSLRGGVAELVESRTGKRPTGPMALLTQPRAFGLTVNPISLIYCFENASSEDLDGEGPELEAVVAEVTNTPWGERHAYVLAYPENALGKVGIYATQKTLHVSPFFGMDQEYVFRIPRPTEQIRVSIENFEQDHRVFRAKMELTRTAAFGWEGLPRVLRQPFMPLQTLIGIYRQALRLGLARAPFFPHPHRRPRSDEDRSAPRRDDRIKRNS